MKDLKGNRTATAIVGYFSVNGRIYWWAVTCYGKIAVARMELCSAAIFKQLLMISSVIGVISFTFKVQSNVSKKRPLPLRCYTNKNLFFSTNQVSSHSVTRHYTNRYNILKGQLTQ
jgi:hypothetical protein